MDIKSAREYAQNMLTRAGIEDAKCDGDILISFVTEIDKSGFVLEPYRELTEFQEKRLRKLVNRRMARVPLQHILGETCFYGYDFISDKRALIPRPETEILVDKAREYLRPGVKVLDLCTGSGCIIITLANIYREEFSEDAMFCASDISEDALALAGMNAKKHNIDIQFYQGDMTLAIPNNLGFDIITVNPPYIKKREIEHLAPEVRDYDPFIALSGGEDGLLFYRRLSGSIKDILSPGGRVFMEIGHDQGEDVRKIFSGLGFKVDVIPDYSGHDRVVILS